MIRSISIVWSIILSTQVAMSGEFACRGTPVIVTETTSAQAATLCSAAQDARRLFTECGLPEFVRPVEIRQVPSLPEGCAAQYHCGDDRIEILQPGPMAATREPDGPLAFLDAGTFHRSVIVHEPAHAVMDGAPCPFPACVAGQEFVAMNLQVMSLPPADRAIFSAAIDPDLSSSPDGLNVFVLTVDPGAFMQRAWVHLQAQPDVCGYLAAVARGEVVLDRDEM